MADDHKPEKAMAGMLKRQNVWPAPSGEACPDASTLAAYFERALAASETVQWELHFSTCARCQEQLAAMVSSEPPAAKPAADRKPAFALAWSWRWMAPVGAAAVVLIFVLSYNTLYAPLQSPKSADLIVNRGPATQSPSAAEPQKPAEATAEKSETAAAAPVQKTLATADQAKAKLAVDEVKSKKDLADKEADRSGQEFRTPNLSAGGVSGGVTGAIASQPMAAPARDEKAAVAAQNQVVIAQAEAPKAQARASELDRAQLPKANAAPEKANQQAEQVTVEARAQAANAQAPSANKQAALRKEGMTEQRARADILQVAPAAPASLADLRAASEELVVSTPKSGVLWRFKDAGKIERTQDGGKTWSPQKNPTQENILAAAAPSETVCWAGGSNGLLLRTMDGGETWAQMPSPTKYAIVSLKASDHIAVTVLSADGHRYETRDAGAHWRPL